MNIVKEMVTVEETKKDKLISRFEINICYGSVNLESNEFLVGHFMQVDRIGNSYVDFFLSSNNTLSGQQGFEVLKKKMNIMSKRLNFVKVVNIANNVSKQQIESKRLNILNCFDPITYSQCSNYSIIMRKFSFEMHSSSNITVNLREVLNLFIADGFYKYQTNYMNSKMNYADIRNICFYIIYKIKTQNFLNIKQDDLVSPVTSNPNSVNTSSEEQKYKQQFIMRRKLITLSLGQGSRLRVRMQNQSGVTEVDKFIEYQKINTLGPFF